MRDQLYSAIHCLVDPLPLIYDTPLSHRVPIHVQVCFWALDSVPLLYLSIFFVRLFHFNYYSFIISYI